MKNGIIYLIIGGIIVTSFAPIIFTQLPCIVDFSNKGDIGSTIGGITSPFIGILSILLLFYTLWEQIKFNKAQKEISADEQFKSTFFTLLQTQRDILSKISGEFSFLNYNDVSTESKKEKCEGLKFFSSSKIQLQLIYSALNCEHYYRGYDSEEADSQEYELRNKIITGTNIPPEIEQQNDELELQYRLPCRVAYINDKYLITKKMYEKYKELSEENKIGLGYAFFFNKYESIGYYFRHIYQILKFIKMNEDEKKRTLGNDNKEQIHDQFKQYAQFVQAQMSTEELLLLFYNSFTFKKAQELIIHYDLLENLTIQNLISKRHNCKPELILKDKDNIFIDLIKDEN
jgi:hypothetical protein